MSRRGLRPRGGPLPTPQSERAPAITKQLGEGDEVTAWIQCSPLEPVALGPRRPQVRVGRVNADITLPHKEVSRRHAAFRVDNGALLVEDLGSSNGTYLNHVLLRAPATLIPGDCVGIGPYELRISRLRPNELMNSSEDDMNATAVATSLAGDLSEVSIAEVFQDLEFHQRSGVLEVRSRREQGRLDLERGVPCRASFEERVDREALLGMLRLKQGRFVFSGREPKNRSTLPFSLSAILLDHARSLDEGGF